MLDGVLLYILQLQGGLEITDWGVFKTTDSECVDHVTGYIDRLVDECIPTKTVRSFPNYKPWMKPNIRNKLREHSTTFKSGDSKAKYDLRKATKTAKTDYKNKL